MKKLSAIFLVLSLVILTASAALAANDLSALSDAELEALRQDVLDEFQRREVGLPEDEDASRQAFTDETTRLMNQVFAFFASWRENDLDGMLALCLPEWQAMCENPRTALFCLLANRTALDTDIIKVESDGPEDSARTVTVDAEVDRNNGTAPALYRLQIRMVKSADGLWYVDPKCLVTYETTEENAQAEPTAEPQEAAGSEPAETDLFKSTLERAITFFSYWGANRQDEMMDLCLPEWRATSQNSRTELFEILQNKVPLNMTPITTEFNQEKTECTITVTADFSIYNGKSLGQYRIPIRMVKSADGLWYVDPDSLRYYVKEDTASDASGGTVLYYNPSGGQYYHIDPYCLSVHPSFLPLAGSFTSGELNDEPYISLEPCSVCGAPVRPSAGSVQEDTGRAAAEPAQAAEERNLFQPAATEEDKLVLRRMLKFFVEWREDDLDGMLAYCMPEWQAKQDSPRTNLFLLLLNRTALSLQIEGITPAETEDSFRRVLVDTEMDRHNGEDPARFLLVVWMVKSSDGLWYFDPGCLENPDRLDLVTRAEPAQDATADESDFPLYYIPVLGEYYHRDQNCKDVNPKYLPLSESFMFSELNDEPYVHLKRCNVCGAPLRPEQ